MVFCLHYFQWLWHGYLILSLGRKKSSKKNCQIFDLIFYHLSYVAGHTKGQLISKCLFGVFRFFQKTNENKSTWFFWGNISLKNHFDFVWPKIHFEINWPLEARAEILQKISVTFWAMEFQKNCIWDLLTFNRRKDF